jgi:hypothetical protein
MRRIERQNPDLPKTKIRSVTGRKTKIWKSGTPFPLALPRLKPVNGPSLQKAEHGEPLEHGTPETGSQSQGESSPIGLSLALVGAVKLVLQR